MPRIFVGARVSRIKPILLITRPAPSAARFIHGLAARFLEHVELISSPLLEIIDLQVQIDLPADVAVIFSSSNAVACCNPGQGRIAYCIGAATAQAAQTAGWAAQIVGENANALVANLPKQKPRTPLIHFVGQHQRGDIASRLTEEGITTQAIVIYNQNVKPLSAQAKAALGGEVPVFVPLFSPRTAQQFASELSELPEYAKNRTVAFALSEAVAAPMYMAGIGEVIVTSHPTAQEMRVVLEKQLATISLP